MKRLYTTFIFLLEHRKKPYMWSHCVRCLGRWRRVINRWEPPFQKFWMLSQSFRSPTKMSRCSKPMLSYFQVESSPIRPGVHCNRWINAEAWRLVLMTFWCHPKLKSRCKWFRSETHIATGMQAGDENYCYCSKTLTVCQLSSGRGNRRKPAQPKRNDDGVLYLALTLQAWEDWECCMVGFRMSLGSPLLKKPVRK